MSRIVAWWRAWWAASCTACARRARDRGLWILVVLAFLPALTAAPGRMPADSKLYLYLDPQRLMSDAFHNHDPRQFAGWVPHQHIAYLWPSGPWFGAFDLLGVPDWIAHRLWIGTLLLVAGLGVRWLGRLLGLSPTAALVAAVVYQCSPYLLPYVSRTSVMLLPWAGLGWIVGLTMLAARTSRWRHAVLAALVVFTVGAVNATALAMIAPAPVLWLLHAATARTISWGRAFATAARIGVSSIAVSLWWMVALVLQGRHGADVLAFSETLEATTFTSSAPEVIRGLGYWLFYVRDPFAATTTAAIDHLASGRTVAMGLVVVLVGALGLVLVRWHDRRFALWLLGAGVVLGVGLHPFDDPAPLIGALSGDGERGLALALRSSTRAVPMSVLALALGAGALVGAFAGRSWRGRRVGETVPAAVIVTVALLGLPALWTGGFVDPALERDQDPPAAWRDAVAELDPVAVGHRVLQVPGAEFGAFRWGYTVDQPIPGLSDTPLVTRDLLPLGSPSVMDLLYALDDRFQQRILEPDAVAPIARLLGVHTVWLVNDQAYDRFRTARPDVVADWFTGVGSADGPAGLGRRTAFGDPAVNHPQVEMVDEEWIRRDGPPRPLPAVELLEVLDPVPVVRAATRETVVVGDGAGLVDAAASGLLQSGAVIRQTLAIGDGELDEVLAGADHLIVTDTDRPRARHWRSSQDTLGMTEDASGQPSVLRPVDGDARLEYGRDERPGHRTTAEQRGPLQARATSYGEPFAYRPEHRAVMALDGDPTTAWLVADRFDAVGEAIELRTDEAIDHLVLVQPVALDGARRIGTVEVSVLDDPGRSPVLVELDDRSGQQPGQRIELGPVPAGSTVRLAIVATSATPGHPDERAAVGFSHIGAGVGTTALPPTTEVVVVPDHALRAAPATLPVAIVLTRERANPTDRWRSDPEPVLRRTIALDRTMTFDAEITVRLDRTAADADLGPLFGIDAAHADQRLHGVIEAAGWAALDGRDDTWWVTPIGRPVGARLTVVADGPLGSVDLGQPSSGWSSPITSIRVSDGSGQVADLTVDPPDPSGRSSVDLSGFGPGTITFEVTGVDPVVTIDRRYGEPTVLPAAVSRLEGAGLPVLGPAAAVDTGCIDDLLVVDGTPVSMRITGEIADLVAGSPVVAVLCDDGPWQVGPGELEIESAPGHLVGLQVDRIVLRTPEFRVRPDPAPRPTVELAARARTGVTARVDGCADGCWFVLGEGLNDAWTARVDGVALPAPQLVDGGSNGWWLPPGDASRTVEVRWGPQWQLTLALTLTAVALVIVTAVALLDRRLTPMPVPDRPAFDVHGRAGSTLGSVLLGPPLARRSVLAVGLGWIAGAGLLIAPLWALAPVPVLAAAIALRSLRPAGLVGVAMLGLGAVVMVQRVLADRPAPDAAWVLNFTDLHRPALFAVTALVVTAIVVERPARAT